MGANFISLSFLSVGLKLLKIKNWEITEMFLKIVKYQNINLLYNMAYAMKFMGMQLLWDFYWAHQSSNGNCPTNKEKRGCGQELEAPRLVQTGGVCIRMKGWPALVDPRLLEGDTNGLDMSLASAPGTDGALLVLLVSKTSRCRAAGAGGVSLGGQPGAPQASSGWQLPCPAPIRPLGCALNPTAESYPVAQCCVVLRAVGDLGLAIVQDAPDDRNAGHLLPTADRVLRLLKGHNPTGYKERGLRSESPGLSPSQLPRSL